MSMKMSRKKVISNKQIRFIFFFLVFFNAAAFVFYGLILKRQINSQFTMQSPRGDWKLPVTDMLLELPTAEIYKQSRLVNQVDCRRIFMGDRTEQLRARRISKNNPILSSLPQIRKLLKSCSQFRQKRGYNKHCTSRLEREFPLAFSITMYTSPQQVERLLRAIYRPHNVYCIHVDRKAESSVIGTMVQIASCLKHNVILSRKSINVRWGESSLLEAEMACMEELLNRSKSWKYFINLAGQEFPLKTNYELVRILRAYDGANDIEGTIKRMNKYRFRKSGRPPHNLTATKGSIHIVVNRDFVRYAIYNPIARDLRQWAKNVIMPEETFFSTLNYNPQLGIRGSFKGANLETNNSTKPFIARFVSWFGGIFSCHGKYVRGVCVFGVGDLPKLYKRKEMFTNKFYWNYQHFAIDCMEEFYFNKTMDECRGRSDFNESYYKELDFVRNKV